MTTSERTPDEPEPGADHDEDVEQNDEAEDVSTAEEAAENAEGHSWRAAERRRGGAPWRPAPRGTTRSPSGSG